MLVWLWLSLIVLILDQATKRIVDTTMALHESIPLIPMFQLTYLRNQGAAFSFLSGAGGWQRWFFIILAISASGFICYWLRSLPRQRAFEACAWSLVLADSAITVGVVMLLLDSLISRPNPRKA